MTDPTVPTAVSADQRGHEAVLREVGATLLAIEAAADRARRARASIVGEGDAYRNSVLALETAIDGLERLRRRLHQETYLADAQQRLF